MRLLKRLLRGPHERRPRHLDSCAECRHRQRRERQYLERLRGAEVPVASDDLTARLLARTEELARERTGGRGAPATRGLPAGPRFPSCPSGSGARRRRRGSRRRAARRVGLPDGRGPRPAGRRGAGLRLSAARPCRLRSCCRRRAGAPGRRPAGASPANPISPRPGHSRTGSSPPCAPRAGPAPNSASSATTSSGPGQGCSPAATSWNCGSPTAGTSPPSSNSTAALPRAVRRAGRRCRTPPDAPVNVLTGRPATSDGFTAAPVPAAADADGRRGRDRPRDAVGQPCRPLRRDLPGRRRHLHVRLGPAGGAGRRRRGRPRAGQRRGNRAGRRRRGTGQARQSTGPGTISARGWSAAWAGSWSCWPRDRPTPARGESSRPWAAPQWARNPTSGFHRPRGHAPCVTAESSQLRVRG